jgi:hypothetical protein
MDVTKLIAVARTVAEAIVPGAPAAIAAGEAVLNLVRDVRPTLAATDQAALDAALPDLLVKMNRNVDQAIADLGGTNR